MARPRNLDRAIEIKVFADVAALNKAMGNVNKSFGGIQGAAFKFNQALGALQMVMQVVGEVADVFLDAAFAASDLDQAIGKSRAVFGDYSQVIESFSRTTATSLGVSRIAAIDASGSIGNVFTSLGVAEEAAASFGVQALKVAADMGAFANLPIEEALLALRSGLVGETEPLRRFGVVVYDAAVKAKALEEGLWDGKGTMEESAKVMARWLLIQDRTVNMTGSFNREIDTLQVQLQKLNAELKDTQTAAGEGFVDPVLAATKAARGFNLVLQDIEVDTGFDLAKSLDRPSQLFSPFVSALASLAGAFIDVADEADQTAISVQRWSAIDAARRTRDWSGALSKTADNLADVYTANRQLIDLTAASGDRVSKPWKDATAALDAYLDRMEGMTADITRIVEGLDSPTLRDALKDAGKVMRDELVGEMLRSDDPERVARATRFINKFVADLYSLGKTKFRATGDKLIDDMVKAAFANEINTAAVNRWLAGYQRYLNQNPLVPKFDLEEWWQSTRRTGAGGNDPDGRSAGGKSAPSVTVNVSGIGADPVKVGRAVAQALNAYRSRAGTL